MRDDFFYTLKNRILHNAMDLWGVKDLQNADPVLDLLTDIFAYELSKLYQEVEVSNAQLLHRLSSILVDNKWTLPLPSHGLFRIFPNEEVETVQPTNHFYTTKRGLGLSPTPIYFTPLVTQTLYNAFVKYTLSGNRISYYENFIRQEQVISSLSPISNENACWIGIEATPAVYAAMDELLLTILIKHSSLYSYAHLIRFYDIDSNEINVRRDVFKKQLNTEEHYYSDIISYYQDHFYSLSTDFSSQKLLSLRELSPEINLELEGIDYDTKLLWIKIVFPNFFTTAELQNIRFTLNTIPVVNRQQVYKQHNVKRNGRIASLPCEGKNYLLNLNSIWDNNGHIYQNILNNYKEHPEGTYSLYFGDLEKFDVRNAKTILQKTMYLVREEGSAFAAMNPEKLNTDLEELMRRLDTLERKMISEWGNIDEFNDKTFLLTTPYPKATTYELSYWTTNAEEGNGFDEHSVFHQHTTNEFDMQRSKLITPTIGGATRHTERAQINNLRYGLLSKERIVSEQDIRSYLQQRFGEELIEIKICSGTEIAKEKRRGIIRTTEVHLSFSHRPTEENAGRLALFLQQQLTEKSISNIPYRVFIK